MENGQTNTLTQDKTADGPRCLHAPRGQGSGFQGRRGDDQALSSICLARPAAPRPAPEPRWLREGSRQEAGIGPTSAGHGPLLTGGLSPPCSVGSICPGTQVGWGRVPGSAEPCSFPALCPQVRPQPLGGPRLDVRSVSSRGRMSSPDDRGVDAVSLSLRWTVWPRQPGNPCLGGWGGVQGPIWLGLRKQDPPGLCPAPGHLLRAEPQVPPCRGHGGPAAPSGDTETPDRQGGHSSVGTPGQALQWQLTLVRIPPKWNPGSHGWAEASGGPAGMAALQLDPVSQCPPRRLSPRP